MRFLLAVVVLLAHRRWDGCAYPTETLTTDCDVAVQRFRSVGLYDTPLSQISQGKFFEFFFFKY